MCLSLFTVRMTTHILFVSDVLHCLSWHDKMHTMHCHGLVGGYDIVGKEFETNLLIGSASPSALLGGTDTTQKTRHNNLHVKRIIHQSGAFSSHVIKNNGWRGGKRVSVVARGGERSVDFLHPCNDRNNDKRTL